METTFIPSRRGYDIPCHDTWNGEDRVVIVCHGFGSSKSSLMVQALERYLPERGTGVFAFDLPAHGESPVWDLRVTWCMDDLAAVEEQIRARAPGVRLGYFGSSFGAFTTLNSLAAFPHAGKKAFLRSSAVVMHRLVDTWVDEAARREMAEKGYFVPDYDYVREMRVTPLFLEELAAHNVFKTYRKGEAELFMVHGGRDSVAPVEAARRFASTFGASFLEVPEGEHDLMGPGQLDRVLEAAGAFFADL